MAGPGRPFGSTTKKTKRLAAALGRLYEGSPERLDKIADAMSLKAEQGDPQAATWIRDTVDGKPAQVHVGDDEQDAITTKVIVTGVRRREDT